jgi:cytidyltransferase-like protein
MKIIYTKMVADLFHPGHVNFLRNARALGDRLVVHIVDDLRVSAFKREPVMTQEERMNVVAACRYVDQVTAVGPRVITLDFMRENNYSIYAFACSGSEELVTKRQDCPDLPDEMLGVLSYTPGVSTTALIQRIQNRLPR